MFDCILLSTFLINVLFRTHCVKLPAALRAETDESTSRLVAGHCHFTLDQSEPPEAYPTFPQWTREEHAKQQIDSIFNSAFFLLMFAVMKCTFLKFT